MSRFRLLLVSVVDNFIRGAAKFVVPPNSWCRQLRNLARRRTILVSRQKFGVGGREEPCFSSELYLATTGLGKNLLVQRKLRIDPSGGWPDFAHGDGCSHILPRPYGVGALSVPTAKIPLRKDAIAQQFSLTVYTAGVGSNPLQIAGTP